IIIRGFTTGIDDEDIPEEAKKQISDVLKAAIEKVEGLVESYKRGELEQMPGRSLEETLEVEAMKILGRARDQAGQIAGKHLGIENSAVIMARSGARGSMLNLSQMAGSIGQQAVRGERLSRGYWNRTEHGGHDHPVQVWRGRRGSLPQRPGTRGRHRRHLARGPRRGALVEGTAPRAGDGLVRPHGEGHVRGDLRRRGRSRGGRASVGGVTKWPERRRFRRCATEGSRRRPPRS